MSEEAPTSGSAGPSGGADDAATGVRLADPKLAYDYFKSMASISVATLGGILTLGEAVFGERIAPLQMGLAALPVAIAGLLAIQGKTDVMQLCQGIRPPLNSSRLALRLVPALYGLGVGIFLAFLTLSYVAPDAGRRSRPAGGGEAPIARVAACGGSHAGARPA